MVKFSALPADTTPSLTDILATTDVETMLSKKVTIQDIITLITGQILPIGAIEQFAGRTAPSGWLFCYGQAISRSTYASLFNIAAPSLGTFTVTIASPGVVTLTAHGLRDGDAVYLTTTGALPTGLSANTLYYLKSTAANTFRLAATRGGADINTSGTQSGTHTLRFCPYGLGDGSTTFNVPDYRGRTIVGDDGMGGSLASRVTGLSGGVAGNLGAAGGLETHTLSIAELAVHNHSVPAALFGSDLGGSTYGSGAFSMGTGARSTGTNGSGSAHNNVQPSQVASFIIKY